MSSPEQSLFMTHTLTINYFQTTKTEKRIGSRINSYSGVGPGRDQVFLFPCFLCFAAATAMLVALFGYGNHKRLIKKSRPWVL
jgi:hypothetical protein